MMQQSEVSSSHAATVSVVIPTFNHAKFLNQALQSIIEQSHHNWEAIIVNNFSTDDTLQIIESFNEPRFKVVNFQNNGVIATSRNEGIRRSSAPFIAFLDSDDMWYSEKLSRCLVEFEGGNDLVCHGEKWVSSDARQRNLVYGPASKATHDKLLFRGNCLSTSATIVRRDILNQVGGFSEDSTFTTAEDYELWLKISQITSSFIFLDEILGEYRRHELGASSSVLRHLNAELAVVNSHISLAQKRDIFSFKARNRKAKAIYSAGRTCMRVREYRLASSFFLRAVTKSPFFVRSYAALALTIARWVIRK